MEMAFNNGFQSRDKTAMLVHKTIANDGSCLCIIIESNSQKTFFSFVLCTNMAAMTSGESHLLSPSVDVNRLALDNLG